MGTDEERLKRLIFLQQRHNKALELIHRLFYWASFDRAEGLPDALRDAEQFLEEENVDCWKKPDDPAGGNSPA